MSGDRDARGVDESQGEAVRFARIEELLVGRHDLQCALYLAANAPGLAGRAARLGSLLGASPLLGALALGDKLRLQRGSALVLAGLSQDRIERLSVEFAARFLGTSVRREGWEVLAGLEARAPRLILLSGWLSRGLEPLAEALGASALLGAELELRDGVATGRLDAPWQRAEWIQDYAAAEGIALERSYAYGCDAGDAPLLEAVGFPCAVNPGVRLDRLARKEGWPTLPVGSEELAWRELARGASA